MGLGGCYGILKFFVILINILFFITGGVITVISTWKLIDPSYLVLQDANNYIYGFGVQLVVGILLLLVGTLGCCGAFKESQCLLIAFFSVLLVVIVAQLSTAVWAYMNFDQLHELVTVSLEKTVAEDYGIKPEETETFDVIQKELQCCGAQGPKDWASSKYGSREGKNVDLTLTSPKQQYLIPKSCCNSEEEDALCSSMRNAVLGHEVGKVIFSEGCIAKVTQYAKNFYPLCMGLAIAAGLLELIGLVLSIILCCAVRFVDRYKA